MNTRSKVLSGFVLALAAVNLWRWSMGAAATPPDTTPGTAQAFRAGDFVLTVALLPARPEPMRRDLFAAPLPAEALAEAEPEAPSAPLPPEEPPPKTAAELATEAAQQELSQLRLVGIVFREGKGRAYLVKGEEVFLVAAGDKLGSRFTVEKVSTDHVELRDPDTQMSGRVSVNGE